MAKTRHFLFSIGYYALVYILLTSIAVYFLRENYRENAREYSQQQAKEFLIGMQSTLHHYRMLADDYYHQISQDSALLRLLCQSDSMDLLQRLQAKEIAAAHIERFRPGTEKYHFNCLNLYDDHHLTFVRLNNPELIDYNAGIAPSLVARANETQSFVEGFETGPASAGFRFVYPLFYKNHHCGCLEMGVDFIGLREELKNVFPFEFRFLINKNLLLSKTPFSKLDNFKLSDLSEDYVYEKTSLSHFEQDTSRQRIDQNRIIEFNKILKKQIRSDLQKYDYFGHSARIQGMDIFALFIKIYGPDKNDEAFIIIYSNDSTGISFYKNYVYTSIFAALFILLLMIAMAYAFDRHKKVKQQNQELENQAHQLRELNQTKDKFFSVIAHDLRNPFHGLVGLTQVLVEDYDSMDTEKVKRFHNLIYQSAKQGYQLVINLLEWIRSQSGRINFNPERLDLGKIISDNIKLARSAAQNKNITLINRLESGLIIYADYNMIHTIFRNLISNAIKFSNPGGTVTIEGEKTGGNIVVKVIDQGIGMDEETRKNLFRIDVSQSSRGTAGESGTGLGLILCKEFVARHNGEIKVESEKGKGSTFMVILPAAV
ncbi:MAG: sensor histidine kinase [Bacteroidales bacterium]